MTVRQRTPAIRQFIIDSVRGHPRDLVALVARRFNISRQAVHRHIRELIEDRVLSVEGRTKSRQYRLCTLGEFSTTLTVTPALQEDIPWSRDIRPHLAAVPKNVLEICAYGFTEMLNNVIDHSGSADVTIHMVHTAASVSIEIADGGIGIFRKIKEAVGLEDEREAILELSKGKLTTDPTRHSGEGIFFTSRMVDVFSIASGSLKFTHIRPDAEWLNETNQVAQTGTTIQLVVSLNTSLRPNDVFEQFSSPEMGYAFSKTHVPIRLAQFGPDNLISRSQAKRIATRFEQFAEVLLDFAGVDFIGQAFADEIFRVFQQARPEVTLHVANANSAVANMIQRAQIAARSKI
ncbi:MAG TPA: DUF4325 domain-containing protein [Pirellulaceae bacterium]|jgi:anti-sigma regulatory factor (Ser/Thr protein kinase)